MIKLKIILLAFLLLLNACATQSLSLKKEATKKIYSIDQVLIIPQNNLDITITPGNPGSSGIIGALLVATIDSVRRSSAEKEALPIINELHEYDFRSVMLDAMHSEIKKQNALNSQIHVTLETVDSASNRWAVFDRSNASSVLFTQVQYRLNSGNLIVEAKAEMYPKAETLYSYREKPNNTSKLDKGNMIYRKNFKYEQQRVLASDIRSSLSEAANSIARQIITDLAHPI